MTRQVIRVVAVACSLGIGLAGCGAAPADVSPLADVIFFGSNIVTMDPNQPTVDAVAVRGETITAAGSILAISHAAHASTGAVPRACGSTMNASRPRLGRTSTPPAAWCSIQNLWAFCMVIGIVSRCLQFYIVRRTMR